MPIQVNEHKGESVDQSPYQSDSEKIAELQRRVDVLEKLVLELVKGDQGFDSKRLKEQMDSLTAWQKQA